MVPPEQTNAEAYYYLKQMQSKTPIVVRLVDGEELRGWIEWYDKDVIKLNREHAPNLLIPKRSIKYLFKEEEERMHKRRRRPPGTRVLGGRLRRASGLTPPARPDADARGGHTLARMNTSALTKKPSPPSPAQNRSRFEGLLRDFVECPTVSVDPDEEGRDRRTA